MTYTLAMKASLSQTPKQRPSFVQLLTILKDLTAEVGAGSYLNSRGSQVVRLLVPPLPRYVATPATTPRPRETHQRTASRVCSLALS
jgi:hypothetical protein